MVKNLPAIAGDAGDVGLISGSERFPGMENGDTPVFLLGNPTNRGAWQATVHAVTESLTQLRTHTKLTGEGFND